MYVKQTTTTFWIFYLAFVSIHHNHNQFKFTNAAAIVKPDAAKQQLWLRQWFSKGPTREVIGDVEHSEAEADIKLQRHNTDEGGVAELLHSENTQNVVKPKKPLQYLFKEYVATIPKINDTGGGVNGSHAAAEDDQDQGVPDLMKLIKLKKQSEPNKIHLKHFKQNSLKANGDALVYDFKENLQKLLKSPSDGDDNGHSSSSINKSQHDNVYMATSASSTIKRAATQPTTPQPLQTNSMAFPFPGNMNTNSNANATATASAQQSPFVERRHIVPEKLQYTKEITIKQGRLMGIRRNFHTSTGLRDVDQYLGIPYAEAPVGSRRFMPPGTPLPWQGLKMAHHLPPVCPQKLPDISMQGSEKMSKSRYRHLTRLLPYLKAESEDCLYLNVYVPNGNDAETAPASTSATGSFVAATSGEYDDDTNTDTLEHRPLYPVIVYIHGESFEWNSGNAYDGSVLASYGEVVVVTVNYRIGILGFMRPSINENTVANFGLLDQIAALHWIKENIHSFGGDKDSVTLMGHSTGAACVNYLMVSPVASGLFHRAILMSGSAMSDWAATNHSMQLTMQIAHGLNCPLNDDNEEMLSCLRQKRYHDILKIPTSLSQFSTSLGPIVDGHVIPNQPYKVMGQYTEHFSRYDLLFGITESESYHSLGALALEEGLRENERDNLLRFYMQSRFDVRPDLALAATLKKYSDMYTNPIKATNMEHRDVVLDILSDARVVGPLMQTGVFHAEVNRRNYMYVFGHNSFGGPHASLPHSIAGEELAFVFGAPLSSAGLFHGIHYTPQEKLLAEAVMSYWCNFVKTGNPKAPWKNSFINLHALEWDRYDLEWPEFNKRSQAYMNIGIPPSVGYKYRQVYMNFWNKELPDELNQIALIQQQPFLEASYANTRNMQSMPGTTAIYPKHYGPGGSVGGGVGSEVITGHMNKFGARDNGVEDPVRTLKLLMQEPHNKPADTAENMYNAPPSTTYVGKVRHRLNSAEDGDVDARNYDINYNGLGYGARAPATSTSIYGIRHYDTMAAPGGGGPGDNYDQTQYANPYHTTNGNYVNEDNKAVDGMADTDSQEHVAKSETTLQLLIGLIIIFIILNVIIYSTILMQKKKKTQTIQRKLGTGILAYDGTTDDDLKRSKPNTNQDDGDSYIMDAMRKSNTYEAVKTERGSLNGFKISRQLSCSTVDTHTKVSEWMSTAGHNKVALQRSPSSNKNSKKSSSFSSIGGSGSFGKHPLKVSVAIDATPATRGSSVSEQEPIEITKMKQDGRNIIICQDVEVEDQELLTPQDSLDTSRYTLMRQHSTVTEACEGELIQPLHYHSRSDPVDMFYRLEPSQDEKVTSFIQSDTYDDVNVTSRDDNDKWPAEALTLEQQLDVIKRRKYPKVLPTFMQHERETDSPPMTKDLSMTYKRNSLPPNSFSFHAQHVKQQPPLPPPRTVATLGRNPSPGRRNSSNFTTSPLMLAHDCTEEEEEPKITQNTLIVGSLKPTEGYYSTLKRKNKPPAIETNANIQQQIPRQPSVFQSFESSPIYETPEREMPAHLTEKIYSIQAAPRPASHHPSCYASEPTTPATPTDALNGKEAYSSPNTPVYAQPKKSHIPRVIVSNSNSLIHSTITQATGPSSSSEAASGAAAAEAEAASTSPCKTEKDTTNCCHVTPMALDENQVSSEESLQQTPATAPVISTTTGAMNNSMEQQQLLTMTQSRIPQLHRNANVTNYQSQHQHLINKDKTNANLIPRATNILTSTSKQTSEAATTPSAKDTTSVIKPSKAPADADDDVDLNVDVVVTAGVGILSNPLSNKKTASVTSSCSSNSSTCSSMQSESAASSSSTTSSSTGTVRTELLQHK